MSSNAVLCTGVKIIGCLLAAAAVSTLVYLGVRRIRSCAPPPDTDNVDGGVVKRYWADAPKVIESTEIVTFHCELSLLASCDADDLGHRVYILDAVVDDGEVTVRYDWRDRQGGGDKSEYKADVNFMADLQAIVSSYNFAQHNGYYHTVSGLPNMYGQSLNIVYDSGERINVRDNQSGFLPTEATRALITLFGAATNLETE